MKSYIKLIAVMFFALSLFPMAHAELWESESGYPGVTSDGADGLNIIGSVSVGDSIIESVNEPGLGERLTFGVPSPSNAAVFCQAADVDTDFGLSTIANPTLYIFSEYPAQQLRMNYASTHSWSTNGYGYYLRADINSDNGYEFNSVGGELVDTNGRQAWFNLGPTINQSGTGAYDALYVNVTETALGDGSTGDGNNLINAAVSGTSKFRVSNDGDVWAAGDVSALTFTDRTPFYEGDALADIVAIKGVDGKIDHDTLPAFAHTEQIKRIRMVAPRVEVTKAEAFEDYQADVPIFDVVADPKTGKIHKKVRVLSYKTTGYEMSEDGEVKAKTEPVYETEKVTKQRLKEGYEFDETDGKFYRKGKVTITEKVVPGRDLGAMISILTKAVQQLTEKNDVLEAKVAALEVAKIAK